MIATKFLLLQYRSLRETVKLTFTQYTFLLFSVAVYICIQWAAKLENFCDELLMLLLSTGDIKSTSQGKTFHLKPFFHSDAFSVTELDYPIVKPSVRTVRESTRTTSCMSQPWLRLPARPTSSLPPASWVSVAPAKWRMSSTGEVEKSGEMNEWPCMHWFARGYRHSFSFIHPDQLVGLSISVLYELKLLWTMTTSLLWPSTKFFTDW